MLDLLADPAEAWSDDGPLRLPGGAGAIAASRPPPPTAVRSADAVLRRRLHHLFGVVAEERADVLVVDLAAGDRAAAGAFDGALLVLSDDAALARDTGIAGVLPRNAGLSQVAAAVAALAEGLRVRLVEPAATRREVRPTDPDVARPLLTPRERQVLALVGDGLSNKTIARRLAISAHTVKYHLEAVYGKLGARSRAEAVSRGLRQGLLEG